MKRGVMTISLSPRNADAVVVAEALKDIPARERSAKLLRWAAAYLAGEERENAQKADAIGLTEDEIDTLLDDW